MEVDKTTIPHPQNNRSSTRSQVRDPLTRLIRALGIDTRTAARTSRSAVGAGAPEDVAGAAVVEQAAEHEEVVGEAVEVFERLGVDLLATREFAGEAFGAPRDRAREMEMRGDRGPTRQDERVERSQCRVHRVDLVLEAFDLRGGDAQRSGAAPALFGRAQVGAEIEEVVLDAVEHLI